jgi:hypothetical protein
VSDQVILCALASSGPRRGRGRGHAPPQWRARLRVRDELLVAANWLAGRKRRLSKMRHTGDALRARASQPIDCCASRRVGRAERSSRRAALLHVRSCRSFVVWSGEWHREYHDTFNRVRTRWKTHDLAHGNRLTTHPSSIERDTPAWCPRSWPTDCFPSAGKVQNLVPCLRLTMKQQGEARQSGEVFEEKRQKEKIQC